MRIVAFVMLIVVLVTSTAAQTDELTLTVAGTYETGAFDEGAAEIGAYDAGTQRMFVTNAQEDSLDIFDISDVTNPTLITKIVFSDYGAGINSAAVYEGLVATAIEAEAVDGNGQVVFLNTDGEILGSVEVGVLPDMVTFTHDGTKVLTANEAEPSDDYTIDAEGSVSIIDIAGGVEAATVTHVTFTAFNDALPDGIRVFGPGSTPAQDFEPEYIAVSPDDSTAYVTLQENNAIAVIDIASGSVTALLPLGTKDHSLPGNGLDAGKDDGEINIANWPILGLYMPDAIAAYEVDGEVYLVTANEGDTRDYDGFSEEADINDLTLDPEAFPNAEELLAESAIGGFSTTTVGGDLDDDGDNDVVYGIGTRSYSIWNSAGELVFDSGDKFEQVTASAFPDNFNASNDDNSLEDRSDNKGPEPEGVTLGVIGDQTYAFVGLERIGGVMVFNITAPATPAFVTYVNNRDFSIEPGEAGAGDLGPEGLVFVSAESSPSGNALLIVTNEVSGSTTIYEITQ